MSFMSYRSLLKMRCRILTTGETQVDGLTSNSWVVFADDVRCFLDLNFIRSGKDPIWVPDSPTAQNRAGVLFLPPDRNDVQPSMRIQMIKGPGGTFVIDSSLDEAWTPTALHHLECYVSEVDRTLA